MSSELAVWANIRTTTLDEWKTALECPRKTNGSILRNVPVFSTVLPSKSRVLGGRESSRQKRQFLAAEKLLQKLAVVITLSGRIRARKKKQECDHLYQGRGRNLWFPVPCRFDVRILCALTNNNSAGAFAVGEMCGIGSSYRHAENTPPRTTIKTEGNENKNGLWNRLCFVPIFSNVVFRRKR